MDENLNMDSLSSQFNQNSISRDENEIMVIGVGGGGGNAVNHMYKQGVDKVTFVAINTDKVALEKLDFDNRLVIGSGRGAGAIPEVAREAAERDLERIKSLFGDKTKMVFVTAGMGGGTGTGAAPVVARVAKERGLLTIGIVTIPFVFEGRKKILKALDGADELAKHVDALLIINNERLVEIYGDLNFFNAFGKADDTLSTAARSISDIINVPGYINLDFNDVDTTLRNGGTAIISTGYGEGPSRVTMALQNALNSPLLKNRDILGSKRLLINLYVSETEDQTIAMNEMGQLSSFVDNIDQEVDVIWGVTIDNSLGEQVKVIILAAGFDVTIREEEEEVIGRKREYQPVDPKKKKEKEIETEYGTSFGTKYVVLAPEYMDDDRFISEFEGTPTYLRDKRLTDSLNKAPAATASSAPADDPLSPVMPQTSRQEKKGGFKIDF